MSFLKRLFGGGHSKTTEAARDADDPLAQDRYNAALYDRRTDPAGWANAHYILANNIVSVAASAQPDKVLGLYSEAAAELEAALKDPIAGAPPGLLASMSKLRGEICCRQSALEAGDAKRRSLKDGIVWLARAAELSAPETDRGLWCDAQIFRGACLQDLAIISDGREATRLLDEAAACFNDVMMRGAADDKIHPIGAFNLSVVLERRAERSPGAAGKLYLDGARRALEDAMSAPEFSDQLPMLQSRLSGIDAQLADRSA